MTPRPMLPPFPDDQTITVRYVPHAEAPGRPVRIDYGTIAHEYITRADAIDVQRRSLLTDRCQEATGLDPAWVQVREAYSQLAAVLGGVDAAPAQAIQATLELVRAGVSVPNVGPEPRVTESDFDLFPVKPGEDADGGFTVLGGCKVSDDDGGRPCPPEHETTIDFAMDLRAPGSDPVHAPSHYTDGGIETIDYLRAKLSREAFVGFCQGNALKYLSRAGKKGSAAEDFAKAAVYCRWAEEASG